MIKKLIEFVPLTAFLAIGFGGETEDVTRWQVAWKISSCLASIYLILNIKNLNSLNRIFFSVNIYLLIGGVLAWLSLGSLLEVYGELFRGVSLFGIMCIVGILTTKFSDRGYINLEGSNENAKKYSWALVGVTVVAGVISLIFRENQFIEGTVPFLLVYITSSLLRKKAENEKVT